MKDNLARTTHAEKIATEIVDHLNSRVKIRQSPPYKSGNDPC